MVIDIKDRVKSAALQGKIVTASEAALLINPNDKSWYFRLYSIWLCKSSAIGIGRKNGKRTIQN